jgi:hypothetical protein
MNCLELQKSLAEIADGSGAEQQTHLKTCSHCSNLVAELNLIAACATELRAADEPSPRVWNSIESALRREGLIHPPRFRRSLIPSLGSRWGWARWMAPVSAALLIAIGLFVHQHSVSQQLAANLANPSAQPATSEGLADMALAGLSDDDLLQEIAQQTPAMKAQYEDDLRRVNLYIQDAKGNVAANPNDEEARRSLMEAYQEKAMLFELALDRSLP